MRYLKEFLTYFAGLFLTHIEALSSIIHGSYTAAILQFIDKIILNFFIEIIVQYIIQLSFQARKPSNLTLFTNGKI
jgi:hypothetical protein